MDQNENTFLSLFVEKLSNNYSNPKTKLVFELLYDYFGDKLTISFLSKSMLILLLTFLLIPMSSLVSFRI